MLDRLDKLRQLNEYGDPHSPMGVFLIREDLYVHWHENIEILYIQEGRGVFCIQDERIEAGAKDILFVNRNYLHSSYAIGGPPLTYYAIVFNRELLGSGSPDPFYSKYIHPLLEGRMLFPTIIRQDDKHHGQLSRLLDELVEEHTHKLRGYEVKIKSLLHMLLVDVLRGYMPAEADMRKDRQALKDAERFSNLFDYIRTNYHRHIMVADAASMVYMSRHHFCKTIKKVTGYTFVELLNLYRVNAAEEMLRMTTLTVTQVAEQAGFESINYFDRIFKQYKGYAPSVCRK